jgi:hypothetical protein
VLEQLLVRERVDEVFGKVKRLIWARSVVLSHVFAQRLRRRRAHPNQIKPLGRSGGAPREPWRTTSISTRRFFGGAVADEDPRSMLAVTSPIAIGKRKGRSALLCKKKSSLLAGVAGQVKTDHGFPTAAESKHARTCRKEHHDNLDLTISGLWALFTLRS